MKRTFEVQMISLAAVALLAVTPNAHARECSPRAALELAHAREVEARARYFAYADRAEKEGLPAVAFLFRVVARGESVHAAKEEVAIVRTFGGSVSSRPKEIIVLGTAENLRTAIECEKFERGTVYPLIEQCLRDMHDYEALWRCTRARNAEATHEDAFETALAVLHNGMLAGAGVNDMTPSGFDTPRLPDRWFLCSTCGAVGLERSHCGNCGNDPLRILELSREP